MSGSHSHDIPFDGASPAYRRALWWVIGINATMFAVEAAAGQLAGSKALMADALDFFADALTYGLSLAVIGGTARLRAGVAMLKGVSLLLMGGFVLIATALAMMTPNVPEAPVMGAIGFLALLANLASVGILLRYRDGDANVRSVWLCSRNDAIGNVAVMVAALGVWGAASGWPDLIVAAGMAGLFVSSAVQILRQAWSEWRGGYGPLKYTVTKVRFRDLGDL